MKTKTVNQYKCDFCGKKGYSAGHMKNHETHCTKNPNRKCRMCDIDEEAEKIPLPKLMTMLPEPVYGKQERNNNEIDYFNIENKDEIEMAIKQVMKKSGCPACTLAALRQKKINVRATSFNYKKEAEGFFADNRPEPEENYGNYY